MTTELTLRDEGPGAQLARAQEEFTPEARTAISKFIGVPEDHESFMPFLSIAASLKLNPIFGEIWLIETTKNIKVNGQWQKGPVKYSASVGRDGLLKIARRDPSFLGVKHDVVCSNDTFSVKHDTSSFDAPPIVTHVYPDKIGDRGQIIGAWAMLYLKNRPPVYYFAPAAEHAKSKDGKWSGSWSYTSTMLIKAAVSYVLRLGTGITGVLPADEIAAGLPQGGPEDGEGYVDGAIPDAPEKGSLIPEGLWEMLISRVGHERVEAIRGITSSWTDAEIAMKIPGLSDVDLIALAEQGEEVDAEPEIDEKQPDPQPATAPIHEEQEPPVKIAPLSGEALLALQNRFEDLMTVINEGEVEEPQLSELKAEAEVLRVQIHASMDPAQEQML